MKQTKRKAKCKKVNPFNESFIQRQVLDFLALKNIFCWRANNISVKGRSFNGLKGVPDIICILNGGGFLGIEVKSLKGKRSDVQKTFELNCVERGGLYLLVRSIDDCNIQLKKLGII